MRIEAGNNRQEDQLVIFRLASEAYGVDIAQVQGIERMQVITFVPHAPPFIQGVINLRGHVTPVMMLRSRLGLEEKEHTKDTRIVVVRMSDRSIGLIVDAVQGVLRVTTDQIEAPSELVTSVESEYIRGIAKVEEDLLIILDLEKVLRMHAPASATTELAAAGVN